MTSEVRDYIASKGWKILGETRTDNETWIRLELCPFCRDKKGHFYICAETAQYKCHAGSCGVAGSFYTLKKYLGDIAPITSIKDIARTEEPENTLHTTWFPRVIKAHQDLLRNPEAMEYLRLRKFSMEAITQFVLGVMKENGVTWLLYPYFKAGQLYNIKFRTLPPAEKAFKRVVGGKSLLFNEDILGKEDLEYVIITEGEADCLALWSAGERSVIGVTVGAGGVEAQWIELLDKVPRIYFVYDRDLAGMKGAYKFANRLGLERCYDIRLPATVKDVNEFFMRGGTLEDFTKLRQAAKPFDIEDVKPLSSVIEQVIQSLYLEDKEESGLDLPWASLQKLTGKFSPGDLVIIGGKPGTGKSSFALNFLYYYSTRGIPVLLFELEMRPERLVPRLIGLHLKKDSKLVNNMQDLADAYNQLKDLPLYFAYKYRKLTWQVVEDTIRMCTKRYGLRAVVFDNIHFLTRGDDPVREVSLVVNNLKLLAEELGIVMISIARPRKTRDPRKMDEKRIIDSEDLMWSSDIEGDADFVLLLHRDKVKDVEKDIRITEGIFMPKTLVRVDKARYSTGGDCFLMAKDAECRFDEF